MKTAKLIPLGLEEGIDVNGKHHPGNTLNDLTGKDWLKFTKSWFIYDGPQRTEAELLHPAKFPEGMVVEFVKFFTKKGDWVLDPFLGTGSTLVACNQSGRNGIGIELIEKYARIARRRVSQRSLFAQTEQIAVQGDSTHLKDIWVSHRFPLVDFVMTSPPYWNMLRTMRGGVVSAQRLRGRAGLDTHYSESPVDLGNIASYEEFVNRTAEVFGTISQVLKPGKYVTIVVQNVRDPAGTVRPLAWDLAARISATTALRFQGERVWCQDAKKLGIWGYPKIFVPNYHHHYCLIFRNGANGAPT